MGIERIIRVLLARWKILISVFLVAGVIGVAIAYKMPKTYIASAVVVVESRVDPVVGVSQLMAPNFLATQVDIIRSSRVSNKVIKGLNLTENPTLKQQYQEAKTELTFLEWLAGLLQKNLLAEPGRGSNVVRVSYASTEPRFSALMANAFVAAYLDSVLEMRIEPARRYSTFFDDRSKVLRDNLEKAQAKLSEAQKQKSIVDSDGKQDSQLAKLSELEAQLLAVQALAIESSSRQAQSQQSADRTQEVLASGLISGIKQEIFRQEAKLQELGSRLGDNNPQVIDVKNNLAEMRSKLDIETKRVTSSVGITATINRQREAELKAAVAAQRAKVLELKLTRDDLSFMQRDVEAAQRAYDGVQQRYNQSSLESENQQTNISVLNQAEIPNETTTQILIKNGAKALIAALGLAVLCALVKEYFDKRVRVVQDISAIPELLVIGVMPGPDGKGFFKRKVPSLQRARLLRQLPFLPSKG